MLIMIMNIIKTRERNINENLRILCCVLMDHKLHMKIKRIKESSNVHAICHLKYGKLAELEKKTLLHGEIQEMAVQSYITRSVGNYLQSSSSTTFKTLFFFLLKRCIVDLQRPLNYQSRHSISKSVRFSKS